MNRLRIIPFEIHPAAFNMAADDFALSLPGTTLRFYGWSRPTLSFGRYNTKLDEIDLDVCRLNNLELVKRMTGGKTVLHHHELTYSICSDIHCFSDSILQTYRMISQPLSESLNALGVEAMISPKQPRKKETSICFQEVSAYEIAVNHKKLVGSAQFRKTDRFLQHGSILIDLDWKLWKEVWKLPPQSMILEKRITTFYTETGQQFDRERFTNLFARKLADTLQLECSSQAFSPEETAHIKAVSEKYRWLAND